MAAPGGRARDRPVEIDEGVSLLERALDLAPSDEVRAELSRELGRANALKFDGTAFWAAMERSLAADTDRASRAKTYSLLAFETSTGAAMWDRRPTSQVVDGWIERALEVAEPVSAARARALIAQVYWHPERGRDRRARPA